MAFDAQHGGAFIANTNFCNGTTNPYQSNSTNNQAQHPAWTGVDTAPDLYLLLDTARRQHAELLCATEQHRIRNMPCTPTQSLLPRTPMSTMPLEAAGYPVPGLVSHTTSRRSSMNPPFSPNTIGSIPTPPHPGFACPNDISVPDEYFGSLEYQLEIPEAFDPEVAANQSLLGLNFSPRSHPFYQPEALMMADHRLDMIQEQEWKNPFSTVSQPGIQGPIKSPSRRPASYDRQTGTWEMVGHSTWTHVEQDRVGTELEDLDRIPPHVRIGPVRKEDYPSVQCEGCSKEFTGQYAAGNMRRHAKKHVNGDQRRYVCSVCEKSYKRSDALRSHERQKHASSAREYTY